MSPSTPFATLLPAAAFETILLRLAALFLTGAGGDMPAARQAAVEMLSAYNPQTRDELCLAASIVGFTFQALEALGQAAAPDLPITRVLRLRSGAVSLSRESEKAQRRLSQLQNDRRDCAVSPRESTHAEPIQPEPDARQELALPSEPDTRTEFTSNNPFTTKAIWTQAEQDRIAANVKRAEALVAARASQPARLAGPGAHPGGHGGPTAQAT